MNDSPCNAADWQPSPAFNSSTPILGAQEPQQIPLALDYAPPQVRKHGLRDAHWTPLAGWYRGGPSFRTTAQLAWRFPLLELDRTANSYAAIGLDVDGRENVISFMDAVLNRRFPEPNFVVERHVSGNIQAHFCLATPIHRGPGARERPIRALVRVSEYLVEAARADHGYTAQAARTCIYGHLEERNAQRLSTSSLRRRLRLTLDDRVRPPHHPADNPVVSV